MTDSLCSSPEITTMLQINYTPITFFKKGIVQEQDMSMGWNEVVVIFDDKEREYWCRHWQTRAGKEKRQGVRLTARVAKEYGKLWELVMNWEAWRAAVLLLLLSRFSRVRLCVTA